jgi:hypothetical protein
MFVFGRDAVSSNAAVVGFDLTLNCSGVARLCHNVGIWEGIDTEQYLHFGCTCLCRLLLFFC